MEFITKSLVYCTQPSNSINGDL
uniref:Uncharacterized protein n=1 Tax=Arundo donax TaxID=35708 RepID=A0A0A9BCT4_ARUDO